MTRWPPRRLADILAWVVLAWVLWRFTTAHRWFAQPPISLHDRDEGYISAFALRMIDGRMLPFVDAVSHRGPMLYWIAAIAAKIFDPLTWYPVRACAFATTVCTVLFTFLSAWRAGRALAGALASLGLAAVFLVDMWPLDGMAFNGEHALNAFMMPALYCVVAALDRARARPSVVLLALAGVLGAMGALCKQTGAVTLPVLGMWVLCAAIARDHLERRTRWLFVGAFAIGVALPVVATVTRYAAGGHLRTLWYWTVTYNVDVYMAPFTDELRRTAQHDWIANHITLLGIAACLASALVCRTVLQATSVYDLARRYDGHGLATTVVLGTVTAIAASNASLRDFRHYYVQVAPWGCLLVGLAVELAVGSGKAHVRRLGLARVCVVLPLVVLLSRGIDARAAHYAKERDEHHAWTNEHRDRLCHFIRQHSKPSERIFVWGFGANLYVGCRRRPASRFVYTTMVAGFVPWFVDATKEEEEARAVPGSRRLLLEDLRASKPPVIVDAADTMGGRSIRRYGELDSYVVNTYCDGGKISNIAMYLRRTDEGRCPSFTGSLRADGL